MLACSLDVFTLLGYDNVDAPGSAVASTSTDRGLRWRRGGRNELGKHEPSVAVTDAPGASADRSIGFDRTNERRQWWPHFLTAGAGADRAREFDGAVVATPGSGESGRSLEGRQRRGHKGRCEENQNWGLHMLCYLLVLYLSTLSRRGSRNTRNCT
jgi:hypothetical protein